MPTKNELTILQALPLDLKVMRTQQRIREWVNYYGTDGVYVSFSGGKDSTVLLHIVRELYPDIEAVFVNTGLEYPEIRHFIQTFDNVTILRPKMRFDEVIKKYGYPLISKEVSECVYQGKMALKKYGEDPYEVIERLQLLPKVGFSIPYSYRLQKLLGTAKDKNGNNSLFNKEKWKPLLEFDFNISSNCCNIMKKKPVHDYGKQTGKMPMTAQTAEESHLREQQWLKNGCNGFNMKKPISNPMSFWTEQDILQYIKKHNIPIASVYGDIVYDNGKGNIYDNLLCDNGCKLKCTGCQRTGCIFCGFGAHCKGDDRFVLLKKTHPRQYEYCMGGGEYDTDGLWKPNKNGLGMAHCIDEFNKIYGKDFIKY